MPFVIVAPIRIDRFIRRVVDFAVIAENNVLFAGDGNRIAIGTANNDTVLTTRSNYVMFTVTRINRLNGSCTTGDTVRLLFDITGLLVLGNLCVNGLVSLYSISFNFRVAQARNNFALSRILCVNRF